MVSKDVPGLVVGDQLRFKQVILNLVSNAFKFTEQGKVTLTVAVESRIVNTVMLRTSVADTGIGITPEQQERIFSPFTQADSSMTRNYGGTGLGLTICRRLAGLMDGTIQVESTPGMGSIFHFIVPFTASKLSATSETTIEKTHLWKGSPLSVLVAEDNETSQRYITDLLGMMGLEADCVIDGACAVETWRSGSYDCILMDVQMPVMGGEDALTLIRQEEQTTGGHTPIIAMTAYAFREDRERFLGQGFDGCLPKPFKAEDLQEVLQRVEKKRVAGTGSA
jgi:CheY-like chemotaxis protein/anti-sigma regulatory factor (Ser/Thr protein kinase)